MHLWMIFKSLGSLYGILYIFKIYFIYICILKTHILHIYMYNDADSYNVYIHSSMNSSSCPTLCDAMDCSPPGFSVHGISLARILAAAAKSL